MNGLSAGGFQEIIDTRHFLQVMSDPSGGAMFVVDPKKPVGGHVCRFSLPSNISF